MTPDPAPIPLNLPSAAALLGVPAEAVTALVRCGFLASRTSVDGTALFDLADLKAFVARNSDNGSGGVFFGPDMQPEDLLVLLGERADLMAERLVQLLGAVFPQTARWCEGDRQALVTQTRQRFEAVLRLAATGSSVDADIYDDLRDIGASAARAGTDLPDLLMMLRMSRDLVVQNAVELAESGHGHGAFALSLLLTRMLPAMDKLGDALTSGYWEAILAA